MPQSKLQSRIRNALSGATNLFSGGGISLDQAEQWWTDILWVACHDARSHYISVRPHARLEQLSVEMGENEPQKDLAFAIPRTNERDTSRPSYIRSLPLSEEEAFHLLIKRKLKEAGAKVIMATETSCDYQEFKDSVRNREFTISTSIHHLGEDRIHVFSLKRSNLQ